MRGARCRRSLASPEPVPSSLQPVAIRPGILRQPPEAHRFLLDVLNESGVMCGGSNGLVAEGRDSHHALAALALSR